MRPMNPAHRSLIAVLLIAALVRCATIHYGTNVDEGVYWAEGKQVVDGYVIYRDTQLNKTPLVALVAAAFFVFGDAPIYPMRIAMIGFSLLGLYGLYRLVRRALNEQAALFALLFFSLEPFSCVWAKYLHTSTWAPFFEILAVYALMIGIIQKRPAAIVLSGVITGVYALSKQTAIFMIPVAAAAWLFFADRWSWKGFFKTSGWWTAGNCMIVLPFLAILWRLDALGPMWFDIWTAHHLMAGWFSDHTVAFRWTEFKYIYSLAPVIWSLPLLSWAAIHRGNRRIILFAWSWLIIVFLGNIVIPTHLWKHYFLVCIPPLAILSGVVVDRLWTVLESRCHLKDRANRMVLAGCAIIAVGMTVYWPRNDWTYPGLTLEEERNLARHAARYCPEPFILNLTNPALYVWIDKDIPPVYQGERTTRMPFFMTIAGRGYLTEDDLVRTVERWKTMPIGAVVAYDKYIRQIYEDPIMVPLRDWLEASFKQPQRISVGDSYYGWFLLFEKKREG